MDFELKRQLANQQYSYQTADADRYGMLKEYARNNRRNMTMAEAILWQELRAGRNGERFLRQHI